MLGKEVIQKLVLTASGHFSNSKKTGLFKNIVL